jgi:hypothetical protein
MNFIDFNLEWYKNRINYYNSLELNNISTEITHEAKILHKFLEDILDEGYISTYELFQNKLQASQSLLSFIKLNNEEPFTIPKNMYDCNEINFNQTEKPLIEYLQYINNQSKNQEIDIMEYNNENKSIFNEIFLFTEWLVNSISSNTAVIFLLRDTLLPFIAFQQLNKNNSISTVPLVINRKFLFEFGDGNEIYNLISDALYASAFENKKTPDLFQKSSIIKIRENLKNNNRISSTLKSILSNIQEENICVVESGTHGTMPLLLKTFDERISCIKLYTTLPWFYELWGNSIFSKKYENLRKFETLLSQDLLFKFSSIKENIFYVNEIEANEVKKEAYKELRYWNNFIIKNIKGKTVA